MIPDSPFIFVSGTIGEDVAVEAMKSGAHDYVMKGNLRRLVPAIRRELREAQTRREAIQSDKAMRESEHKYRHLFESLSDAAFLISEANGRIIDTNAQAEVLLGRSRAEIVGMPQDQLCHLQENQKPCTLLPAESDRHSHVTADAEIVRKDEKNVPVQISASRINLHGHPLVLALFRDITDRKRAEEELRASREQLRALAAHLQAIREEERTRVAREIHDELGQMLTALKMDLRYLEHNLERANDPRLNVTLEKAVSATELTDALAKSVQRIATELRPGILDRLGLVTALAYEADQFQQRTGIVCHVKTPAEEFNMPVDSVTAVFRIFQEAMTNVARHANASEVEIELQLLSGSVTLEIRDNGKGIQLSHLLDVHSLGVLGMKERARQIGGDVTFKSGATGGTVVTLRIPHTQPEAAVC
jgi:two-component system sensor histidine kinase UhpB